MGAWFLFGEKLKIAHMIGIVLMLLCAVGLGFGSTYGAEVTPVLEPVYSNPSSSFNSTNISTIPIEEVGSNTWSAILATIFAILCPVSFCSGGMMVRFASTGPKLAKNVGYEHNTINSFDLTILAYLWMNALFVILTIVDYQTGDHDFEIGEYLTMAVTGLIACIGVLCMNRALIIGLAGPVFALCNVQVIIQTILDIIFRGVIPNWMEVGGGVLGVIGACTIAIFG